MSTTPTLISRETIGAECFEISRQLFVTPRGGCGVRKIHRINRVRLRESEFLARRKAALAGRA